MKRVLVTGGDGQLGQCLRKISSDYKDLQFEFHSSKTLDITNSENVSSIFSKGNFAYCINCAAYTNVEQAEKTPEPAFAINAEGVRILSEQCRDHQVTLLHVSTDYVFDGTKKTGYFPDDETNPINVYGKSKLGGELHVQELLERYVIVRTSWLYSEYGNNFYKTILRKAKAREDLEITEEQTGCPTNANHLAKYLLGLIAKGNPDYGVHHFTDGEAMTWYGFAKRILRENNLENKVKLEKGRNYRTLAKRPKNSILLR
ncbi:dTDP-4-dehydrorhamnose reductase [Maribacter sp. 2307UL18-2]|uniref:dTDP-4-dehydrorhamnose reductase n=1 Tax=Maribacter sp. 2307UL18-2 TaxID=3386274 RepID=UPI0039BC4D15